MQKSPMTNDGPQRSIVVLALIAAGVVGLTTTVSVLRGEPAHAQSVSARGK